MDNAYNNGPEGMPRVKRMSNSTIDAVVSSVNTDGMLAGAGSIGNTDLFDLLAEQAQGDDEQAKFEKWAAENGWTEDQRRRCMAGYSDAFLNQYWEVWQARASLPSSAGAPVSAAEQADEDAFVIQRMGELLARVAVAVKGVEPPRRRWSYHDLPELVEKLVLELELYRANATAAQPARQQEAEQAIKNPADADSAEGGAVWKSSVPQRPADGQELPALPEKQYEFTSPKTGWYTAKQMHAYARAALAMRQPQGELPPGTRKCFNCDGTGVIHQCVICASSEPHGGTCGSNDARALCNFLAAKQAGKEPT